MAAGGFSPAQIATVQSQAARAIHEDPAHCTNVAVDDVELKKQKAAARALSDPGDTGARPGGPLARGG